MNPLSGFLAPSYKDNFSSIFSHYQYSFWEKITPSLNISPLLICHGPGPNLDYYNSILTLLFAPSSAVVYSCEKVREGQLKNLNTAFFSVRNDFVCPLE